MASFLVLGLSLCIFLLILLFSFDFALAYDFIGKMVLYVCPIPLLYGAFGYYRYFQTLSIYKALDFPPQQIKKIEDFIPSAPGIYPLNKIYDFY